MLPEGTSCTRAHNALEHTLVYCATQPGYDRTEDVVELLVKTAANLDGVDGSRRWLRKVVHDAGDEGALEESGCRRRQRRSVQVQSALGRQNSRTVHLLFPIFLSFSFPFVGRLPLLFMYSLSSQGARHQRQPGAVVQNCRSVRRRSHVI